MAGWIKMPLRMEVGLGPGDLVLDGAQLPPKKNGAQPIFGSCLLWPNSWIDQFKMPLATDYGGRPRPRRLC